LRVPAGVRIVKNLIRETRGPAKRTGIRIGPAVGSVELLDNAFDGLATNILDQRHAARPPSE
jgi:hypothetical protein